MVERFSPSVVTESKLPGLNPLCCQALCSFEPTKAAVEKDICYFFAGCTCACHYTGKSKKKSQGI